MSGGTFRMRRGLADDRPTLEEGELGFDTDDYTLWIGSSAGNIKITTSGVIDHGTTLGLTDDDHTQYILPDGSRGFTSTVSGIDPTLDYHLTTAAYVNDAITTATGSLTVDHGGLIGLVDDDHTQYILVDGTRALTGTVSGVTPIEDSHLTTKIYVDDAITTATGSLTSDHGDLVGLSDDDHTQYSLADGTRAFTGTVSGITPSSSADLTTKEYVDDAITTATGSLTSDHGDLTGLADDDHTQYILTDGTRPFTGTVSGVTPTENAHLVTKAYADTLSGIGGAAAFIELDDTPSAYDTSTGGSWGMVALNNESDAVEWAEPIFYGETVSAPTISGLRNGSLYFQYGTASGTEGEYILVDGTRAFTGTVSGVAPTEDLHLSTKKYVDDQIATVSGGGGVSDHGALTGLSDDDHTQYILEDGTRAFTGTVSGVTPTENAHLVTKEYADTFSGTGWAGSDFIDLDDTTNDYGTVTSGSYGLFVGSDGADAIGYYEPIFYGTTASGPTISGLHDGTLYVQYSP